METSKRPLENGTANRNNTPTPAPQGNGRRPSPASMNTPNRAALRRPGDMQRQSSVGTRGSAPVQNRAPKNTATAETGRTGRETAPMRSAVAPRQPIRQMTEEQGNGFTLGNLPSVQESDKKRRKNTYIPTKKSRIKEPMPLATIVFSILCTVLVMFMMINFVKINEYTHDIADMQDQLAKLERQEQELSVELEKKNDLTGVDLESIGLVKEDSLKKVEITTDKDETIEHFEVEEEDTGMVATVMNALYRNFKEYRNIFFGDE